MKKSNFFFFAIVLSLLFSCSSDKDFNEQIDISKVEKFTIQTNRDTTLITKEGIRLTIDKKTFNSKDSKIHLEFASFLDKASMVISGLSTMSSNGEILESDGMFWMDTQQEVKINQAFPIRVEVPSLSMASDMKIFKGNSDDKELSWTETGSLSQNQDLLNIVEGKKIFMENCTNCHNKNLDKDMTAPALGNITLFRDSAYLVDFTRNANEVIASGDLIASCLYDYWNKSVMTRFEFLSDDQIINIYRFIESESRNRSFSKNQIKFIDSCAVLGSTSYTYVGDQIIDSVDLSNSLTLFSEKKLLQYAKTYEFNLTEFGWFNVDLFINKNNPEIENFSFDIKNTGEGIVMGYVVFKNRKVIIPLEFQDKKFYLKYGSYKKYIEFPLGEELVVLAFEELENKIIKFGHVELVSSISNNDYEIELENIDGNDIENFMNEILK